MRVLLLTGLYPTPGRLHEGAAVARQCEALRAAGVEVDVLHGPPAGVGQRRRTLEALRRAAARGRYDLVHVHYGLSATGLALLQPLPFVATYHGTDVNGYPFCAWREVGRALAWSGAAALTRQLARFARAVIVMTEAMRRRLPPAVQRKTWVEPMGVDTTLFRPRGRDAARAALGWGPEPIVVFCHPGGTAQKRADLAAAAGGGARGARVQSAGRRRAGRRRHGPRRRAPGLRARGPARARAARRRRARGPRAAALRGAGRAHAAPLGGRQRAEDPRRLRRRARVQGGGVRALVVAAHPDDEVLGCGGTIARLAAEDHRVWVAFLADGVAGRYEKPADVDPDTLRERHAPGRAAAGGPGGGG